MSYPYTSENLFELQSTMDSNKVQECSYNQSQYYISDIKSIMPNSQEEDISEFTLNGEEIGLFDTTIEGAAHHGSFSISIGRVQDIYMELRSLNARINNAER